MVNDCFPLIRIRTTNAPYHVTDKLGWDAFQRSRCEMIVA